MLLLIDIQDKLLSAMCSNEKEKLLDNSSKLLMTSEIFEMPVVVTEQYPEGLGSTAACICNILKSKSDQQTIVKTTFSAAVLDDFKTHINRIGRRTVIVAGMETHICVLQTVMGLIENNYNVIVASDAVCSRNSEHKSTAIEAMRDAGAVIYPTETIMYMLTQKSDIPEFKKILELVK